MKYIFENDKITFRCDCGKLNYSQRNNEFRWVHPKNPKLKMDADSMCNVTSIVMALDYAGYQFPKGKFRQPEDNLCDFIFTDKRVMQKYREWMPAMAAAFERGDDNAYCPNLIHTLNVFATNLWMGTSCLSFKENNTISDICKEVINNRPVILSGTYPFTWASGATGTLGHINVIAGAVYDKSFMDNLDKMYDLRPIHFIIDDPYGDYRNNFRSTSIMNDIPMPYADFIKLQKPVNNVAIKWAYFVKPGAATI